MYLAKSIMILYMYEALAWRKNFIPLLRKLFERRSIKLLHSYILWRRLKITVNELWTFLELWVTFKPSHDKKDGVGAVQIQNENALELSILLFNNK